MLPRWQTVAVRCANSMSRNGRSRVFTLLRKSTVKMMKRKLVRMMTHETLTRHDLHVIGSYHGWVMWCDGYRLSKKYIDPLMKKEIMRL